MTTCILTKPCKEDASKELIATKDGFVLFWKHYRAAYTAAPKLGFGSDATVVEFYTKEDAALRIGIPVEKLKEASVN